MLLRKHRPVPFPSKTELRRFAPHLFSRIRVQPMANHTRETTVGSEAVPRERAQIR